MTRVTFTVLVFLQLFTSAWVHAEWQTVVTDECFAFPLQPGWPVEITTGRLTNSCVIADVDGDRKQEVSFCIGGSTYILKIDGSSLNISWPKSGCIAPTTMTDIDGDKDLEIVQAGLELSVYHHGGSILPGWPFQFSTLDSTPYLLSSPVCASFYGKNLFFIGSGVYNLNRVYLWQIDGTIQSGFPLFLSYYCIHSPAITDIDSDGEQEIVFGCAWANIGYVLVTKINGNIVWNINLADLSLGPPDSDISIADIDGDFRPEIMVGLNYDQQGLHRDAVVFKSDGTIHQGWPKVVHSNLYGGLSVGDIDGNKKVEVACVTSGDYDETNTYLSRCYVWNGEDGSDLPGWPKDIIGWDCAGQNVLIGDIDGDCDRELVFACFDQATFSTNVYAFHHDGTMVNGFPLTINGFLTIGRNSCFITDLDNDGYVEIGVGVHDDFLISRIYIWKLPYPYRPRCQDWPQYHHDAQHTGNYNYPEGLPLVPDLLPVGLILLLFPFSLFLYPSRRAQKIDQRPETLTRTE